MGSLLSRLAAGLCGFIFAVSCSAETETFGIVDAAELYESNRAVFSSIRAAYPGPYQEFTRIPSRNPADDDEIDREFLKILRKQFSVEFIDFFPIGDTGADEINVVLKRYQAGNHWNTVSLVYFGMAMTLADNHQNMRMFETCDQRASTWLEANKGDGMAAAFCRLSPSWYAYQKIE